MIISQDLQFLLVVGLTMAFHGAMLLIQMHWGGMHAVQGASESRWKIGRYSEADVYRIMTAAIANLPAGLRNLRIRIAEERRPSAWTWLMFFWPGLKKTRPIILASGCLYYLEEDELQFVILHEIGHHVPQNRLGDGRPGSRIPRSPSIWPHLSREPISSRRRS